MVAMRSISVLNTMSNSKRIKPVTKKRKENGYFYNKYIVFENVIEKMKPTLKSYSDCFVLSIHAIKNFGLGNDHILA